MELVHGNKDESAYPVVCADEYNAVVGRFDEGEARVRAVFRTRYKAVPLDSTISDRFTHKPPCA